MMSVRAYKIIKIEFAEQATFNLWEHPKICAALDFYDRLSQDGCGEAVVYRDTITSALEAGDWNDEERAILQKMLADCGEDDFVNYSCH